MTLNSLVNVYWLFIVSLKHHCTYSRLHGVTSQKMVIFLATTMRTSNLTVYGTVCIVLLVTSKSWMLLTECILVTSHIVVHADNVICLSLSKDDNDWFAVNFLKTQHTGVNAVQTYLAVKGSTMRCNVIFLSHHNCTSIFLRFL